MKKTELKLSEIENKLAAFSFPEVDLIVGIANGGLQPVKLIADLLNKSFVLMEISYRDKDNSPLYKDPILIKKGVIPGNVTRILLVDDVSVSGKTMGLAKQFLNGYEIFTFVLKGKADFVLFPEIKTCVAWPW